MNTKTVLCFVILCTLGGRGAEFDLGIHGVLSVAVPAGWTVNGQPVARPNGTSIGYTFSFKPSGNANAKCLLSFIYVTNRPPDQATIRKDVLRISEKYVSVSVEKRILLRDFSLENGYGVYCVFTDASLVGKKIKAGEFKVMGSGEVQPSKDMLGAVSLFADDADGEDFKTMVKIINSLKVKPNATK